MSQTTCCPACKTLFKVVPDQLRVSAGWVRCGQCSEIFDAHLHIHKERFAPDLPREAVAPISRAFDVADTQKTEPVPLQGERDTALAAGPETGALPAPAAQSKEVVVAAASADAGAGAAGTDTDAAVADVAATVSTESAAHASPPVTFLRESNGNMFWSKRWVRASLALTGLGLVAVLAVQVLVHQRDRIAATLPAAKPFVVAVCQILNCKISPLRQIESLVIDGSTFTELRGNAYRLGFTIKNMAPVDLAMPALELTLTDSQDRAALRRVFLPSEMGATSTVLGAGGEWTGTLVLSVRANGSSERIAGYRISALYP